MKKTVIIVLIAVLAITALCMGVLIMMMPDPAPQIPVDIHTNNSLIETLGIERVKKNPERLIAIKTYEDGMDFSDILAIAQIGGLEYHELDKNSNDYLLIVPLEIGGQMTISGVRWNTEFDRYEADPEKVIVNCNGGKRLPDNYALLLKYSRPEVPQCQINLAQDNGNQASAYIVNMTNEDGSKSPYYRSPLPQESDLQTATYQIVNMEKENPVKKLQFIRDDVATDIKTESFGDEIEVISLEENSSENDEDTEVSTEE